MAVPEQNEWCIVYRKHGNIERVFPVTKATGDKEKVVALSKHPSFQQFGGDTGKHTISVERFEDVRREERGHEVLDDHAPHGYGARHDS